MLVGELEPLHQLLGGDVVLQIQSAEQLFYLHTNTRVRDIIIIIIVMGISEQDKQNTPRNNGFGWLKCLHNTFDNEPGWLR